MADHDRRHEPRPDRAARLADASSTSGRAPPSSPASSASRTCCRAPSPGPASVRLDDGTRSRSPPETLAGRAGARRRRHPAREDRLRRPAGENRLAGRVAEIAYVGVSTQYVVETPQARRPSTSRTPSPAAEPSRRAPRRRSPWSPDSTFVVDSPRRDPHDPTADPPRAARRAALGGAALSLPGPARRLRRRRRIEGADGGATTGVSQQLADTLRISNWPLYIDIDEKTKKRPTLQQFQEEFGVNVRYVEDVNDNDEFFGKVQAPL